MQPPHCSGTTTQHPTALAAPTNLTERPRKTRPQQGYSEGMDFDPDIPRYLRELRHSTWYINGTYVQVTHPTAFALQALQVTPQHTATEPRGVVWVRSPGPYSCLLVTVIRAFDPADLLAERGRLGLYLGNAWSLSVLASQMPVASSVFKGRVTLPTPHANDFAQALGGQVVPGAQARALG